MTGATKNLEHLPHCEDRLKNQRIKFFQTLLRFTMKAVIMEHSCYDSAFNSTPCVTYCLGVKTIARVDDNLQTKLSAVKSFEKSGSAG